MRNSICIILGYLQQPSPRDAQYQHLTKPMHETQAFAESDVQASLNEVAFSRARKFIL